MRKRLVFRVDDLGYTPAYDMGAYRAFDCGVASSADVMFDSPDTIALVKGQAMAVHRLASPPVGKSGFAA